MIILTFEYLNTFYDLIIKQLLIATSAVTETSSANNDDTLEEIVYVLDRGLNYVPKRLIDEVTPTVTKKSEHGENAENLHNANVNDCENDENQEYNDNQENYKIVVENNKSIDEDEVIVVESSPETSFITTQNTECFKSAFDSIETTYHTAKSEPSNVSVLSIDSDSDSDSISRINKSEEKSSGKLNNLPTQEREYVEEKKSIVENCELNSSAQRDVASSSDQYAHMPKFNDTLERVEYMMEQGRKMLYEKNLKQTPTQNVQAQHAQKKTPISQPKQKVMTPGSSVKKAGVKYLTPNKVDMFKRPEQRNVRSPFAGKSVYASKVHAEPHQSRIPMKTSSLQKPQFRHIASPIAAYINNTPEVPLIKTIRPARNLLNEDFNKVCPTKSLDESTQSVESFPTKSALPRKMYISATQRKVNFTLQKILFLFIIFQSLHTLDFLDHLQIIDHRYIVTPGNFN